MGLVMGSYMSLYIGNTLVIPSAAYSATHVINALHQEKCNIITGTPTMFYDILSNPKFENLQLPHLNKVLVAGSPIPMELYRHLRDKISHAYVLVRGHFELCEHNWLWWDSESCS